MGAVDWGLAEKVAVRSAGREPFAESYHYESLSIYNNKSIDTKKHLNPI